MSFSVNVKGHVLIKDSKTGEVLLDKFNAVHNKNMAIALARALASDASYSIYRIKLGNGGTSIDSLGDVIYQSPNVIGNSATLYNATYEEIVDDSVGGSPADNSVTYQESPAPDETTVVICSATISSAEPQGQAVTDSDVVDNNSPYAFDELGLFTADDKLLSHIIFSPILKTQNRELIITYNLTIAVA